MKSLLVVALLLFSLKASAETQPVTKFHALILINGHPLPIESEGAIRLPSSISSQGWTCGLTPEFVNEEGNQSYRNIWCQNTGMPGGTVGITAACPIERAGSGSANFFIRGMNASVEFVITCETSVKAPRNASSSGVSL